MVALATIAVAMVLAPVKAMSTLTTDRWTPLPQSTPSGRGRASEILDPRRNRLVLFGGRSGGSTLLGDVWEMDLGTRIWTSLTAAPGDAPSARNAHTAIYDAANDRMIVYGGFTSAGVTSEVW